MNIISSLFWRIILHHYPQYNWSQTIGLELKKIIITAEDKIVDTPCGNGAISYWLCKEFTNTFELIDRSRLFTKMVGTWSKNFNNIQFTLGDIYDCLSIHNSNDIWLMINSLYLFSNPTDLINRYKSRFKFIFAIFPYLEKENYQHFCKRPFRSTNPQKFLVDDTLAIFTENDYILLKKIDLTSIPFFRYELFGLGAILRYLFSFIDKNPYPKNGQYWLGVFERR